MDEDAELDTILAAQEEEGSLDAESEASSASDDEDALLAADLAGSDEDDADEEEDEDALLAADLAGDADKVGVAVVAAGGEEEDDEEKDGDEEEEADVAGDEGEEPKADRAGEEGAAADAGALALPKRRGKPKDPKAPKRPLLPFQQHCGAERLRFKDSNPDLLKDLRATGKAMSETWEKVAQATKDQLQAVYDKEKAAWDLLMAAYKQTDGYRVFQKELIAWIDARNMKKLVKKQKGVTPPRPKSGYMSFAANVREGLLAAFPGTAAGEISKKIAEKWQALPTEEQEQFNAASRVLRDEWLVAMTAFKRTAQYRACIDEQVALEMKQGQKRLKNEYADKMPKRPVAPFQLWATATGTKGSLGDVSKQFNALSEDQRKPWLEKTEANRVAFKEASDAFASSKDGIQFQKLQVTLKKKVVLVGARKKFLVDAPKRVPGAHVLCLNVDACPDRAGKWVSLSEASQRFWEDERARLVVEYEKKVDEFHQTESWKSFERAIGGGAKAKPRKGGEGKPGRSRGDGKAKQSSRSVAPEGMPSKALTARAIWKQEQKGSGLKLVTLNKQWDELGEAGQSKYNEQADTAAKVHAVELESWDKSKEGKKHARAKDAQKQKNKEQKARDKFLAGADAPEVPSKPKNAQATFVHEKRTQLQNEEPGTGTRELNRRAVTLWGDLDVETKQVYENKHRSLLDVYEHEFQTYKETPAYKKFEKAAGLKKGLTSKSGRSRGGGRSGDGVAKRRKKIDELVEPDDTDMGSSAGSDSLGFLDSDED